MTARNSYATLAEFKAYATTRSGTTIPTDTSDDGVINDLLEGASRYIDSKTTRRFYPLIETGKYDTPEDAELWFDADVLEIISLTNGDSTSIAAASYNFMPRNYATKYGLKLKGSSSVTWQADANGETEGVITLVSINGYGGTWEAVTTLAEDLDTSETAFDFVSGTSVSAGHILRIGNEITIVDSVATNTVTVLKRGDNGSTAATALTGATVYIWRPMQDCFVACLELAMSDYRRRAGQSGGESTTITGAGVVLAPKDIPTKTRDFIKEYTRLV